MSLLGDWGRFGSLDWEEMLRRITTAEKRLASDFRERRPVTPDEVAALYRATDTLIPILLWWHGTDLVPARCAAVAVDVLRVAGAGRVLDFGCGIGSTSLALAEAGLDVVIAEVADEPLRLAAWRLRERGYAATAVDLAQSTLTETVEGVVAFDVLEHVPDLEATLRAIDAVLDHGGVICMNQVVVPDDEGPHHYPRRGEPLLILHGMGYRLTHVRTVCWVAQKLPLSVRERRRQAFALRARIAAAGLAARLPPPLAWRLLARALR